MLATYTRAPVLTLTSSLTPATLTLTSRCLPKPVVGTCSVCQQEAWLEPLVHFDFEDLPVCFSCWSALQSFQRFAHGRSVRVQRQPAA